MEKGHSKQANLNTGLASYRESRWKFSEDLYFRNSLVLAQFVKKIFLNTSQILENMVYTLASHE